MSNDPTILDGSPSFDQSDEAAIYQQSASSNTPTDPTPAPPPMSGGDINTMSVASEEVPSLVDFGREPSTGAWPDGWYAATILPGYSSQNGHQWATEDQPSKDGGSRNLRVCYVARNKSGESRNYWSSFNYRVGDFSVERLKAVTLGRKYAAEQKWPNRWPSEWSDIQRSSLAIAQLGQFERALGFRLKLIPTAGLNASLFPQHQIDIRLKFNTETGFSDVTEFARLGERKSLYK